MTTDLVKRLRADAAIWGTEQAPLYAPAANEIERLTLEVERLREALEQCADDLEAELKARWCTQPDGSCHPALQTKLDRDMAAVNKARTVLAGGQHG